MAMRRTSIERGNGNSREDHVMQQSGARSDDELSRIGVSVPTSLLNRFTEFIEKKGYSNRSEAVRDLMRDVLVAQSVSNSGQKVIGTLTLVYGHHVRQLNDRLVGMQHDHYDQIVSTIHVQLGMHLTQVAPTACDSVLSTLVGFATSE